MARVFTEGAEFRDLLFFDGVPNVLYNQSTYKRSGGYAYHIGAGGYAYKSLPSPLTEFYYRQGFYYPAIYEDRHFCTFRNNTSNLLRLTHDSLGHWVVRNDSAVLEDSGVPSITTGWMVIEIHYSIANSGGIFTVKIDGNQIINYVGDTQPSSASTCNNIYWASGYGGAAYENFYLDDLALNDTTGTLDASWCGDGHVEKIYPDGAGTTNDWSNSGSAASSNNYTYVDEFPNDGNTTYVYASGSSTGAQDQYTLTSMSGAGKNITRIFAEARGLKTHSDTTNIKLGYFPSGGTDQMSGSIALTTSYSILVGTSASTNPVTGLAWTETDLNALEFVVEMG